MRSNQGIHLAKPSQIKCVHKDHEKLKGIRGNTWLWVKTSSTYYCSLCKSFLRFHRGTGASNEIQCPCHSLQPLPDHKSGLLVSLLHLSLGNAAVVPPSRREWLLTPFAGGKRSLGSVCNNSSLVLRLSLADLSLFGYVFQWEGLSTWCTLARLWSFVMFCEIRPMKVRVLVSNMSCEKYLRAMWLGIKRRPHVGWRTPPMFDLKFWPKCHPRRSLNRLSCGFCAHRQPVAGSPDAETATASDRQCSACPQ